MEQKDFENSNGSGKEEYDYQQYNVNEYTCKMKESDRKRLFEHPHTNEYILTPEQLQFLDDNGYLLVKKIVDKELCDQIIKESFQRADALFGFKKHMEETWQNIVDYGIPNIWHLPSLYRLRQNPKVYSVFAQILRTHRLQVSLDRICIKHPSQSDFASNKNLQLHHDQNIWHVDSAFAEFQAGLCLADCPEGGGGFFCIPKFHKRSVISKYMKDYETGKFGNLKIPPPTRTFISFADQNYADEHKIEIPMEQGDLVIWSSALPHNGGVNTLKNHWRLQAFVRFVALDGPSLSKNMKTWNEEYRKVVVSAVKNGARPTHYATGNRTSGNDPFIEEKYHKMPEMTPLGEKVLGFRSWDENPNKHDRKNKH